LGEFLALAVSLEHLGQTFDNPTAILLGETLDQATGRWLEEDKSPARVVGKLDNRGGHFYLALYWAQALATQTKDAALAAKFGTLAKELSEQETQIVEEYNSSQGSAIDLGGYYRPDAAKCATAMQPSGIFTKLLANLV
jgi:isocitrate dehydrogenase